MEMFDFLGYGGAYASVPVDKINGLTREGPSVKNHCQLWVMGSNEPFLVTEPYNVIRKRLGDAGAFPFKNEYGH